MLLDSFNPNLSRLSRLFHPALILLLTCNFVFAAHQRADAANIALDCDPSPIVNGIALVAAVSSAATNPADDIIKLTAGCTYTLSVPNNPTDGGNGLPLILDVLVSGKITFDGNGATINRSSSSPNFRVMEVLAGSNVVLNNLTISGGFPAQWDPKLGIHVT